MKHAPYYEDSEFDDIWNDDQMLLPLESLSLPSLIEIDREEILDRLDVMASFGDSIDYIIEAIAQAMEDFENSRGALPYYGETDAVFTLGLWAFIAIHELRISKAPDADRTPFEVLESNNASDEELRRLFALIAARLGIFVSFAEGPYSSVPLLDTIAPKDARHDEDIYALPEEFTLGRYIPIQLYVTDLDVDLRAALTESEGYAIMREKFISVLQRGHSWLLNQKTDSFEPVLRHVSSAALNEFAGDITSEMQEAVEGMGIDVRDMILVAQSGSVHPSNPLTNLDHPNVIRIDNFEAKRRQFTDPHMPFGKRFTLPSGEDFGLVGDCDDLWFGVGAVTVQWTYFDLEVPLYLIPVKRVGNRYEMGFARARLNPMLARMGGEATRIAAELPAFVPQWCLLHVVKQARRDFSRVTVTAALVRADVARAQHIAEPVQDSAAPRAVDVDPAGMMSPLELAMRGVPLQVFNGDAEQRLAFACLLAQRLSARRHDVALIADSDDARRDLHRALRSSHVRFLDLEGDVYQQVSMLLDQDVVDESCHYFLGKTEELMPYITAYGGAWNAFNNLDDRERMRLFHAVVGMRAVHPHELMRLFSCELHRLFSLFMMNPRTYHLVWPQPADAVIVYEAHTINPVYFQGLRFSTQVTYSLSREDEYKSTDWREATAVDTSLVAMKGIDRIARSYS